MQLYPEKEEEKNVFPKDLKKKNTTPIHPPSSALPPLPTISVPKPISFFLKRCAHICLLTHSEKALIPKMCPSIASSIYCKTACNCI